MKLSNQAMSCIMFALQKSLFEQTDIVPVLEGFEFQKGQETKKWGSKNGELDVINPPNFTFSEGALETLAGEESPVLADDYGREDRNKG
jgi:hypothetical protein